MENSSNLQARLESLLTPEDLLRDETQARLRPYFTSKRDIQLERIFGKIVRLAVKPRGRLGETRALLLVGETGAGKSTALDRIFRHRFPDFGLPGCPLVSVSMPTPATLKLCGRKIAKALGYPLARGLAENVVWEIVMERLALAGTKVLHLDEFQHVTRHANRVEQPKILDTIKAILDVAKVGLVMSGLPELIKFVESDTQVKRRTICGRFVPLTAASDMSLVVRTIESLALMVDIRVEDTRDIAARSLHAAQGQFGQIINLAQLAIEETVVAGECVLTRQHFADVYASETGNSGKKNNPFLSASWHEIDVRRVLDSINDDDAIEDVEEAPKGRKAVVRRPPRDFN